MAVIIIRDLILTVWIYCRLFSIATNKIEAMQPVAGTPSLGISAAFLPVGSTINTVSEMFLLINLEQSWFLSLALLATS